MQCFYKEYNFVRHDHSDVADDGVIEKPGFIAFLKKIVSLSEPPYIASETLTAWQRRNHPWLELSDVHKEMTEGVRVTVIPFYMGCREAHSPQSNDVYWVSNDARLHEESFLNRPVG